MGILSRSTDYAGFHQSFQIIACPWCDNKYRILKIFNPNCQNGINTNSSCQIAVKPLYFADLEATKKPPKHSENGLSKRFLNGARDGTRTHDLLITNQLRYQLRHSSGYSVCVHKSTTHDYILLCARFQVVFASGRNIAIDGWVTGDSKPTEYTANPTKHNKPCRPAVKSLVAVISPALRGILRCVKVIHRKMQVNHFHAILGIESLIRILPREVLYGSKE